MLKIVSLALLFLLALAGAVLEGTWGAMPPVLVQFNGLLVLLSALVLLGLGASGLIQRTRTPR